MEPHRFDELSRSVARGTSRRRLLVYLGLGGLAGWFGSERRADLTKWANDLTDWANDLSDQVTDDPDATEAVPVFTTPFAPPTPTRTPTPEAPDNGDPIDPTPTPDVCPDSKANCSGVCVDLQTDNNNCGKCGQVCPGTTCTDGKCPLQPCFPAGSDFCDGECVDLMVDANHCGGCGRPCDTEAGETCDGGQCRVDCSTRTDGFKGECDGVCVDFQSDYENCGECGKLCFQSGIGPSEICANGTCQIAQCGPNYEFRCPPNNECVDLNTSAFNCGTCRKACDIGLECRDGECVDPAVANPDGDDPAKDSDPPEDTQVCPGGQTACGSICADLQSDARYCGSCTRGCWTGESCQGGNCVDLRDCEAEGLVRCPGDPGCVNLSDDPFHCGTCETDCRGLERCVDGKCVPPR